MKKPTIFISHAHTDRPIAELLTTHIDEVFARGVKVFATSIPGMISPGSNWLQSIEENLETANAVIVLITPTSINKSWIWFETGAFWARTRNNEGKIFPLCVPEIELNNIPAPLNTLQALSLGKVEHIQILFKEMCQLFDAGKLDRLNPNSIVNQLPKYQNLRVDTRDLNSTEIYQSPYLGYSDDDLKQVLDEYLYHICQNFILIAWKSSSLLRRADFGAYDQDDQIDGILDDVELHEYKFLSSRLDVFRGKLIHFQMMDAELQLPVNTSKRLLKEVARKYRLTPIAETENSIRFILSGRWKPQVDDTTP